MKVAALHILLHRLKNLLEGDDDSNLFVGQAPVTRNTDMMFDSLEAQNADVALHPFGVVAQQVVEPIQMLRPPLARLRRR